MAGELRRSSSTSSGSRSSTSRASSRPRTWSSSRTSCAPTSRAPSWPRERVLEPAPDPADGRVPRALAAGVSADLLELSVAEALRADRGRGPRRRRVLRRLREAAAGDELNAYLWRAEPGRRRRRGGELRGVPIAVKDIFCTEGVADHRGLADPRGLPAALHGNRGAQARRGRRPRARQDEHGRVRDGLLERELRLRPGAQPLGSRAGPGRLVGGLGGSGRRPGGALGDRHRHRRLDPPARLALRDRRPEAHLRGDLALRDDRLRLLARPVRAADPRRHRRGPAAAAARRAATRCDSTSVGIEGGVELPSREDLEGLRFGVPRELSAEAEGIEPGVREVFERDPGR